MKADNTNIRVSELVSLSEGGAVCTNIARTDLCGGCRVTDIPTATPLQYFMFLYHANSQVFSDGSGSIDEGSNI